MNDRSLCNANRKIRGKNRATIFSHSETATFWGCYDVTSCYTNGKGKKRQLAKNIRCNYIVDGRLIADFSAFHSMEALFPLLFILLVARHKWRSCCSRKAYIRSWLIPSSDLGCKNRVHSRASLRIFDYLILFPSRSFNQGVWTHFCYCSGQGRKFIF